MHFDTKIIKVIRFGRIYVHAIRYCQKFPFTKDKHRPIRFFLECALVGRRFKRFALATPLELD